MLPGSTTTLWAGQLWSWLVGYSPLVVVPYVTLPCGCSTKNVVPTKPGLSMVYLYSWLFTLSHPQLAGDGGCQHGVPLQLVGGSLWSHDQLVGDGPVPSWTTPAIRKSGPSSRPCSSVARILGVNDWGLVVDWRLMVVFIAVNSWSRLVNGGE